MQTNKTGVTHRTHIERRTSLFGHIARLDTAVAAYQALWLQTNISTGRNPGTSWKRLPGRPRKTWTSQIPDDTGMSSRAYWDASIRHGHGRGTLRSLKTTRWWWWWWWSPLMEHAIPLHVTTASSLTVFKQHFILHLFCFSFPGLSQVRWPLQCLLPIRPLYIFWLTDWLMPPTTVVDSYRSGNPSLRPRWGFYALSLAALRYVTHLSRVFGHAN